MIPLFGTNDSHDIIEKAASESHVVIHTSGTGVLAENVRGKKGSNKVYSDLDPDQIKSLADEQVHRNVDLLIINAAQANPLSKSVIVLLDQLLAAYGSDAKPNPYLIT